MIVVIAPMSLVGVVVFMIPVAFMQTTYSLPSLPSATRA
jgi:hypothetical protein